MAKNEKDIEAVDADNFEQLVEKKAYELYSKRGFEFGHEWEDWFKAEKIVEAEISTVDRDCIRSEGFYKITHRSNPSEISVIPRYN